MSSEHLREDSRPSSAVIHITSRFRDENCKGLAQQFELKIPIYRALQLAHNLGRPIFVRGPWAYYKQAGREAAKASGGHMIVTAVFCVQKRHLARGLSAPVNPAST
jgi:hypothetical protein